MTDLNNNNNNDTFYLAFKDVHPSWSLIGCALPLGIISTFGIIFNFCVIYVTIRTKSLHGTINYLLALCCFFELLHQHGNFLFVYTALSGQNFMEYRLAVKIKMLPAFGLGLITFENGAEFFLKITFLGGIYPTMFFTGLDRMIVLFFVEMQNKRKIRLYLATLTTICFVFCLDLCYTLYQRMELYGDQMITGSFTDFFKGASHHTIIWLFLILTTFIIYIFLGIMTRIKSAGLPSAIVINQRIFRALLCIIFINIGGYFIASLHLLLIKPLISSPITAWFCQFITAIPLNIGSASNGPILYFTSTEYRQAFQTQFPFVFKRISNRNNQVTPQQNNQQKNGLLPTRLITTNS